MSAFEENRRGSVYLVSQGLWRHPDSTAPLAPIKVIRVIATSNLASQGFTRHPGAWVDPCYHLLGEFTHLHQFSTCLE